MAGPPPTGTSTTPAPPPPQPTEATTAPPASPTQTSSSAGSLTSSTSPSLDGIAAAVANPLLALLQEAFQAGFDRYRSSTAEPALEPRRQEFGDLGLDVSDRHKATAHRAIEYMAMMASDPQIEAEFRALVESQLVAPLAKHLKMQISLPDNLIQAMLEKKRIVGEEQAPQSIADVMDQDKTIAQQEAAKNPGHTVEDYLVMGYAATGGDDIYVRNEAFDRADTADGMRALLSTILHEGLHTLGIPGADVANGGAVEAFINQAVELFMQKAWSK